MRYIPERVFDNLFVELDMLNMHLSYVIKELDSLHEKIEEEHKNIQGDYDPENYDECYVWEQAIENILGVSTWFIPYYQKVASIAGYCIVLFHLLERFLEEISYLKDQLKIENYSDFSEKYSQFQNSTATKKIDELRLVANYCKHGTGVSETKLKKERPDYFDTNTILFKKQCLKPLSGYDIKITTHDFENYVRSIKEFATEIKKQWS